MTSLFEPAARVACAIALETMALVVWNVGARHPFQMLRELLGARSLRSVLAGVASLLIGTIFIAAATILLIPAVTDVPQAFIPIEILTFVVALAVEALIGNDLRKAARLS